MTSRLGHRNSARPAGPTSLTATLTTHYWYLATLTSWAVGQGIAPDDADRYVRGLFQGVGHTLSDETRSLHRLAADQARLLFALRTALFAQQGLFGNEDAVAQDLVL